MAREPQVEVSYAIKPIGITVKKASKKEVEKGIFVCPEGSLYCAPLFLGVGVTGKVSSIAYFFPG
jgi:hypothetical protein